LNLQVASAVVNVDLPWNPAKLEQRIARAWRKNQTRSVTVAHLVCENSIEHQILHLLGHKQALADGVLDGQGDLGALKMPSGRAAMIERLQAMMNADAVAAPRILSPEEMVVDDLRRRHGERLLLVEARSGSGGDGRTRLLAVLDVDGEALAAETKRHEGQRELGLSVEFIDRSTWLAMQRLAARGMIAMLEPQCRVLHQSADFTSAAVPAFDPQARAAELRNEAERSLRMARVLAGGGFPEEALPLAAKAIGIGAAARLAALGELAAGASGATTEQIRDLTRRGILPPRVEAALSELWSRAGGGRSPGALGPLIEDAALAIPAADGEIAKAA
jgi:predicted ATPase